MSQIGFWKQWLKQSEVQPKWILEKPLWLKTNKDIYFYPFTNVIAKEQVDIIWGFVECRTSKEIHKGGGHTYTIEQTNVFRKAAGYKVNIQN